MPLRSQVREAIPLLAQGYKQPEQLPQQVTPARKRSLSMKCPVRRLRPAVGRRPVGSIERGLYHPVDIQRAQSVGRRERPSI